MHVCMYIYIYIYIYMLKINKINVKNLQWLWLYQRLDKIFLKSQQKRENNKRTTETNN